MARSPQQHREAGLDLRMRHRVEHLDLAARTATATRPRAGPRGRVGFDDVLSGHRRRAARPHVGADGVPDGVPTCATLDDGGRPAVPLDRGPSAVVSGAATSASRRPRVWPARGLRTTLVTQGAT